MAIALVDAARQLGALLRHYAWRSPSLPRTRVLFYSHVLEGGSFAAVGDHFFGAMLDVAEARGRDEVLLGLFLHADADRPAAERALRARGRRACFVLDHLRLVDIAWTARQLLHCVRAFGREPPELAPLRIGGWASRSFASHYFVREVRRWLPVTELAMYRAMRRLLAASGARTVVYPYEEKGVERAIVRAAAETGGVRTLAYGHPVHTRAHLALRTRRGAPNPPAPDGLLVTGPEAARFLVEWGGKAPARVVAVGSPRHLTPRPRTGGRRESGVRLRVLVVVGHAFEVTGFANLVQARPDLAESHDVLVRSYRFNWHDEQAAAIRRLHTFAPSIRVDDRESLVDQLAWCDAVVFESTTVGVQAMLAGRLAVHTTLHDVFPADPLLGHDGVFARCGGADELAEALAQAAALGEEEEARIVARQRELAVAILAPLDRARFLETLGLNGETGEAG
jgi:hypothetical protein